METCTLGIVTKNRPGKLNRCLQSVCLQSRLPDKIIIVDTNRMDSARKAAGLFESNLPIQYIWKKNLNVPRSRNLILHKTATTFLGFVDDDCILDRDWVKTGVSSLAVNKKIAYISGNTKLFNRSNLIARAQYNKDSYWFLKKIKKQNETCENNVDTKNIIIRMSTIIQNHIDFDENCTIGAYDSADYDFGIKLNRTSLPGLYAAKMIVYHDETSSLVRFISRAYSRGQLAAYINIVWSPWVLIEKTQV